ncbi:MAG TPA: hypothetical protein VLE89_03400 [Chlamydiales bacterium]|nr:hypothetical protein [Chlamydiales bacterium]
MISVSNSSSQTTRRIRNKEDNRRHCVTYRKSIKDLQVEILDRLRPVETLCGLTQAESFNHLKITTGVNEDLFIILRERMRFFQTYIESLERKMPFKINLRENADLEQIFEDIQAGKKLYDQKAIWMDSPPPPALIGPDISERMAVVSDRLKKGIEDSTIERLCESSGKIFTLSKMQLELIHKQYIYQLYLGRQ